VAHGRDNPPTPDEYASAQADRNRLGAAWQRWMQDNRIDAVLEPSVPITAPLRGGRGSYGPHSLRLAQLTPHWNMTGQPVVGLPAGFGKRTQLPVGVSLIGRRDGDAALVQIALDLQEHALPALSWPDLTGAGGSG
jgi:mandelamide amidase